VVVSDMHPEGVARGRIPPVRLPDGRPGRVTSYRHAIGDYVRAALAAGLQVRRCEEPRPPSAAAGAAEPTIAAETLGPWDVWPWALDALVPEAARAALAGTPSMVIWHFQLPAS
jgi:hypothetical protein